MSRINTIVDVLRRELEALRQRSYKSISSFISHWRGKIVEIIHRPSERDQIQMILRSLQPREYLLQTLDLWFKHFMMWMMAFREGYDLILPLLC